MKFYSLSKSSRILQNCYTWYLKKGASLRPEIRSRIEDQLQALEVAIKEDDRKMASELAVELQGIVDANTSKSFVSYAAEVVFAIAIALALAVVVRQMWFELYEIPTGSMRPTFREKDHVAVSKLPFGINVPLTVGHFLFEPDLVQRTGVVTFTSEGIPGLDENTNFMWVIPYKKRLIKRMIGKPGDSFYFYGGKLYGIDQNGNPLEEFITAPWMQNLEYVPFLTFEGKTWAPNPKEELFQQWAMNIGRLTLAKNHELLGEVFNGFTWVKDDPVAQRTPHDQIKTYSDFWGMRNYAMARLLTRKELKDFSDVNLSDIPEGVLYLELRHTPSLTYPKPVATVDPYHPFFLWPYRTVIPLEQRHLDALMDNMYTARLVFKNGRAHRYSVEEVNNPRNDPRFPDVPDGTYEFYYGKAQQVGFAGISWPVPADSPLYSRDPSNIQKLFNLGIEMNRAFEPQSINQLVFPTRYAYFRDGDLYLLGAPILKKDDPTLIAFNQREEKKQKSSSLERPYVAFKDYGPPLKEGSYDVNFIKTFGVTVPSKKYLVLGDNHAMSGDSRVFGFVPESNLEGAPALIIWPPGPRWGFPPQKPYPIFNMPRLIVWGTVLMIALLVYLAQSKNLNRPIVINRQGAANSGNKNRNISEDS